MNILQIPYSKLIGIPKELLDEVTEQGTNAGKKEDNHWIIKAEIMLNVTNPSRNQEVQLLNMLLNFAKGTGYSDVMIIDE